MHARADGRPLCGVSLSCLLSQRKACVARSFPIWLPSRDASLRSCDGNPFLERSRDGACACGTMLSLFSASTAFSVSPMGLSMRPATRMVQPAMAIDPSIYQVCSCCFTSWRQRSAKASCHVLHSLCTTSPYIVRTCQDCAIYDAEMEAQMCALQAQLAEATDKADEAKSQVDKLETNLQETSRGKLQCCCSLLHVATTLVIQTRTSHRDFAFSHCHAHPLCFASQPTRS